MLARAWCGLGLLLIGLVASPARATPEEESDALIRKGLELRKTKRDAEALALFIAARDVLPSPRADGQIGFAAQALGRWTLAHRALSSALAVPTHPWVQRNRDALEESKRYVEEQAGRVEVDLARPAQLQVGGDPLGAFTPPAGTLWLEPGSRTVRIQYEDGQTEDRTVVVVKGQRTRAAPAPRPTPEVSAATPPAVPAPTTPPLETTDPGGARTLGWAAVGIGAAGLALAVAGIALAVSGGSSFGDLGCFEDAMGFEDTFCADARAQRSTGTALGVAGGVIGSLALGTGIVLLLSTSQDDHGETTGGLVQLRGTF